MQIKLNYDRTARAGRIANGIMRPLLIALFGLMLLAVAISFINAQHFDYPETEAVISEITEDQRVFVEYRLGGSSYSAELNMYSSSFKVGDSVTVRYNPDDPQEIESASDFMFYIMTAVGLLLIAFGAVSAVRSRSRQRSVQEDFRLNSSDAGFADLSGTISPPVILGTDESAVRLYYFHFSGRLNQGHIMEDQSRRPVYEAVLRKFHPLSAYEFDFVDHRSGSTAAHMIGHTVTGSSGNVTTASYFTIDGERVWDYLHRRGISIDTVLQSKPLGILYTLNWRGERIAEVETSGTDLYGEAPQRRLAQIPAHGYYRIRTAEHNIPIVFLAVMAISRTEGALND